MPPPASGSEFPYKSPTKPTNQVADQSAIRISIDPQISTMSQSEPRENPNSSNPKKIKNESLPIQLNQKPSLGTRSPSELMAIETQLRRRVNNRIADFEKWRDEERMASDDDKKDANIYINRKRK